jgi:hypothetical protein
VKRVYAQIAVYGSLLALIVVGLVVVAHNDHERSRDICGLIATLDDSYRETPPTTPTGRRVAIELHAYRLRLGC